MRRRVVAIVKIIIASAASVTLSASPFFRGALIVLNSIVAIVAITIVIALKWHRRKRDCSTTFSLLASTVCIIAGETINSARQCYHRRRRGAGTREKGGGGKVRREEEEEGEGGGGGARAARPFAKGFLINHWRLARSGNGRGARARGSEARERRKRDGRRGGRGGIAGESLGRSGDSGTHRQRAPDLFLARDSRYRQHSTCARAPCDR